MTLATDAAAFFDTCFDDIGQPITFLKNTGIAFDPYAARIVIIAYNPNEMIGTVTQTDLRGYLLAADFTAGAIPVPTQGDRVTLSGKTYAILDVDANTQMISGTLLAWIVRLEA